MPIALLLVSTISAATGAFVVWGLAGFWWALAAYSGIGAATLLILAAVQAFASTSETSTASRFVERKVAG